MPDFVNTLVEILHVLVCAILMFVVLLQQGKGGGMGAAMGGGATAQVFGGRGAGNILTRATAICAATFMLTSVTLAWHSSQGDRALKARQNAEHKTAPATSAAAAPKGKDAKPDDKAKPADKPAEGTTPTAPPAPSK